MERNTNAGGGGATGGGAKGGGAKGGGEALTGVGVVMRIGGTEGGCGLAAAAEMETPSPRSLKGPAMSAGTAMSFCAGLRIRELELNRVSTSLSGSTTGSESYSWSTSNKPGAAWRSSPKVIFTTPRASCGMIFPMPMAMVARVKSTLASRMWERSWGGRFSRTD